MAAIHWVFEVLARVSIASCGGFNTFLLTIVLEIYLPALHPPPVRRYPKLKGFIVSRPPWLDLSADQLVTEGYYKAGDSERGLDGDIVVRDACLV